MNKVNDVWINEARHNLSNPRKSYIYFWLITPFDEQENGELLPIVKIGFTDNWQRREKELITQWYKENNGWPDWLELGFGQAELLGIVEGNVNGERALHRAFKDWSLGKEFFSYDSQLETALDEIIDDYCVCFEYHGERIRM